MIKLNDRVWKPFRIGQLFNIKKGKRLTKANSNCGKTPYLSSKNNNNNLDRFISEDPIFNGGQITVNSNGSVGASFYHAYDFWASDNTNVLEPLFSINEYIALFICTSMNLNSFRFGFGRLYSLSQINQDSVGLPSTDSGEPDWQFMEDYIKQFEETKLLETQKTDYKEDVKLPDVEEWGSFLYSDLFEIKKGRSISLSEMNIIKESDIEYKTAYLTSKSCENNLSGFINKEPLFTGGSFTLNSHGSVGYMFFHEYDFFPTANTNVLIPKFNNNKYIAQFIKIISELDMFKWGFGRIYSSSKLSSSIIKLPALENGFPDWELIERYIKSLPYSEMI